MSARTIGTGDVRQPSVSPDVDTTTTRDLLTAVRDLSASVTAAGLSRSERLSRASRAAASGRDVTGFIAGLDPYRDRRHARVADMFALDGDRHWRQVVGDLDAARDRVALADQHAALRHQMRATADLSGLNRPATVSAAVPLPTMAVWLNTYTAAATSGVGPASMVPDTWTSIPDAAIDDAAIPTGAAQLDGSQLAWHNAHYGVNESRQLFDWSVDAARSVEQLIELVVDRGLETYLLGLVTTGAPTATDFAAAEVAVGAAWPTGADVILCAGADAPKVRRAYATEQLPPGDRPAIIATAGATAGTAVVLATPAVFAETTATAWLQVEVPRELGRDIVALRYGRARLRQAGAVQLVTVA